MQKILIYLAASALLGGCAYRMEIQQGNVVTQEQLAQLHTGMSEQQVRHLLGSPLLIDPFHQNRWDYYYSRKQQGQPFTSYRVTVYFEEGKLSKTKTVGTPPAKDYQSDADTAAK